MGSKESDSSGPKALVLFPWAQIATPLGLLAGMSIAKPCSRIAHRKDSEWGEGTADKTE